MLSSNLGTRLDPVTAAAQSAKLKKKHANNNAATAVNVLNLFANANRTKTSGDTNSAGSVNASGSAKASGNNDLANGIQAFLNALNIDARAGLRDRLGRIQGELNASRTDWTKVQGELRAWKDDVNARLKSSTGEAQRKPLSDLSTSINEMQKLAIRVSKENKDQLKLRLSEVSDLVIKLDPPEKK